VQELLLIPNSPRTQMVVSLIAQYNSCYTVLIVSYKHALSQRDLFYQNSTTACALGLVKFALTSSLITNDMV